MALIKTDYSDCGYITPGKLYPAHKVKEYSTLYKILDDTGYPLDVNIELRSAHLNDEGVFELVEE